DSAADPRAARTARRGTLLVPRSAAREGIAAQEGERAESTNACAYQSHGFLHSKKMRIPWRSQDACPRMAGNFPTSPECDERLLRESGLARDLAYAAMLVADLGRELLRR